VQQMSYLMLDLMKILKERCGGLEGEYFKVELIHMIGPFQEAGIECDGEYSSHSHLQVLFGGRSCSKVNSIPRLF
jgi:hypothetical protein